MSINFFQGICFAWAFIGIVTRIVMTVKKDSFKNWALNSAYTPKQKKGYYVVVLATYIVVAFTWYKIFTIDVQFSWIIGLLTTVTVAKVSTAVFNYQVFRQFVVTMLNDDKKLLGLHVGILIFSALLILMGLYLY
ncbi:hypothetical protein F8154_02660 [Alkaliphilus pronyensis]|uniref:Uncharacterized protein n=1 Tax=Alkaliphilus pronyensis TaxID=1482732 RepID=A0A6I0FFM4_9FIRM|nr:hypothetical protein [Alkaliphilus pronyensis]KAB3537729.1 hypothetical protein F8154_02660 [Alkaliphilus pronyensis]